MGSAAKLYQVRAIVLNSRPMRDAHRVVSLFSWEHGKIRAVAHGVTKPTSRKRGAVQPFCHGLFMLRRGRELDSIDQCEGREIFPGLRNDLDRMTWAGYLTELVESLTAEGEPSRGVFSLLHQTLGAMEKTNQMELLARTFEIKLLAILGYRLHLTDCVGCAQSFKRGDVFFSSQFGGLICSACAHGGAAIRCGGETVSVLRILLNWDLAKLERLHVSEPARQELKKAMEQYVQWYLEKRPHSWRFMEQLRQNSRQKH